MKWSLYTLYVAACFVTFQRGCSLNSTVCSRGPYCDMYTCVHASSHRVSNIDIFPRARTHGTDATLNVYSLHSSLRLHCPAGAAMIYFRAITGRRAISPCLPVYYLLVLRITHTRSIPREAGALTANGTITSLVCRSF